MAAFVPMASAKVDGPGTPGAPNCHGQTMAWITQEVGGVGKAAKADDVSMQEVHALIDLLCTPADDPDDPGTGEG